MTQLEYVTNKVYSILNKIDFKESDGFDIQKFKEQVLSIETNAKPNLVKSEVLKFLKSCRTENEDERFYLIYDFLRTIYAQSLGLEYKATISKLEAEKCDDYFNWVVTMPFYSEVRSYYGILG